MRGVRAEHRRRFFCRATIASAIAIALLGTGVAHAAPPAARAPKVATKPPPAPNAAPKPAPKPDPNATALGESAEPAVREMTSEMRAESLFRTGQQKFDKGDFQGACADFQESLRLGPKLGTLLNVALCHENVGRVATAWTEYNHGAAWATQNGQRERYDFALAHAQAIAPQLPRVTLQLPSTRTLSGVDLDGEPLPEPRWYLPIYVDPGEHSVAVIAPGKKRVTVRFSAKIGQEQLVQIPAPPDDDVARAAAPTGDGGRRMKRIAGLGMMGLGVAALGVGTVFGVKSISASSSVSDACAGGCGPGAAAESSDAKSFGTISAVTFLSGALVAAVGVWLFTSSAAPAPAKELKARASGSGAPLGLGAAF